uniref:Uncharacterized protein LOC105852351 n=1 Tax=Cicer arietinum TaxID=3827 RepID=A0A3Q7XDT3_CICAR|nr:uncharacterized protein LOC105852351 [Cicer arietinum]
MLMFWCMHSFSGLAYMGGVSLGDNSAGKMAEGLVCSWKKQKLCHFIQIHHLANWMEICSYDSSSIAGCFVYFLLLLDFIFVPLRFLCVEVTVEIAYDCVVRYGNRGMKKFSSHTLRKIM